MLSSLSSFTTVTALSFQSSMLCAEILINNQCCSKTTLTTSIATTAIHFTFTVHYDNLTEFTVNYQSFSICKTMQNTQRKQNSVR